MRLSREELDFIAEALIAAAGWLSRAGSATAAPPRQRSPDPGMLALHSIPANFLPPRHAPLAGVTVAELCAATIATAGRLTYLAARFAAGA